MHLKILGKSKNRLRIEFKGEDHTLLNLLRKTLWELPGVTFATYRKEHPYFENPILVVKTEGALKPENALQEAAKRIEKMAEDFRKAFCAALK